MRLYNGAPDSELKAIMDDNAAVRAEAKSLGIHLTWFPVEERWHASAISDTVVGTTAYQDLSGFHTTRRGALDEAKATLNQIWGVND